MFVFAVVSAAAAEIAAPAAADPQIIVHDGFVDETT
jgi:hypothetical protein